ncbi:helix-turn-helix domain-containing protein [Curtobacterium sp. PhB115]|uniref:helix-turn-helix domain-containing protein n=1 Tax=Curtobacterium sp. PhB115 TaxID=2485173 RepID=UPI000FB8EAF0|nr:helix-turn-helix domain-containing protein [Curtobacterium sp. PhB115]ROP74359.1 excisionase family DNA binding protein [Curtobacterium sp. PhB115]
MSMTTEPSGRQVSSRTYFPGDDRNDLIGLAQLLHEIEREALAGRTAELRAPDGRVRAIPAEVFEVLEQVADALASGSGVTVARNDTQMTTQQAADFLGVSRPTLVKYLEDGSISFERRGRHRRVLLRDLVSFQEHFRIRRRAALRAAAREDQAMGRSQQHAPEQADGAAER